MKKILIADDSDKIRHILNEYLVKEGYEVIQARDGNEALDAFAQNSFVMILLDVMMPFKDGFEVCKTIRETSNVPIIMITARGDDYDRIMGLDMGADDYVVKPFVPAEVMARIRAILRRIGPSNTHNRITYDTLCVNLDDFEVTVSNQPVSLTKKEIEILWTMMQHPNQVFSRDQLLDSVWGIDYYGDFRTVDAHIKRLRAKLSPYESETWSIATVWGVGYKFEVNHHAL